MLQPSAGTKMNLEWKALLKKCIIQVSEYEFVIKVADTLIEPDCLRQERIGTFDVHFYYNGDYFIGYRILLPVKSQRIRHNQFMIFCSTDSKKARSYHSAYLDDFVNIMVFSNNETMLVLL